jgi:hypothetical protein
MTAKRTISARLRAIASLDTEAAHHAADETIRTLAGSLVRLERARERLKRISSLARKAAE